MSTALVNRPSASEWDVLVVGGGVSGLSCASALARSGVGRVAVLEREQQPGGAPRHIHNLSFGWREFHRPMQGPAYARRLVESALASGVEIVTNASVVGLDASGQVRVACMNGLHELSAKRVCLASGARETTRHGMLVSGARPFGIFTTGALQRYIHFQGVVPFRRPLVVGTEWVSLAAIKEMRSAGIRPVAMVGPWAETVTPRWIASSACRFLGVKLLTATRLERIKGRTRVEGVVLEHQGARQDLECDGVLFTGGFLPEAHLVQMAGLGFDSGSRGPITDDLLGIRDAHGGHTALVACGNALRGVKGSWACAQEGRRAAATIVQGLSGATGPLDTVPVLAGPGVSFVLPQRVAPQRIGQVTFQVMADQPRRGRLVLRTNNTAVAGRNIHAVPGRLMEFKPSALARNDADGFEILVEDRA